MSDVLPLCTTHLLHIPSFSCGLRSLAVFRSSTPVSWLPVSHTMYLTHCVVLTLRAFWIRRAQFNQLVAASGSLTTSRYFRLILLSCLEMCCTIPYSTYSLFVTTDGLKIEPWISWADTHYNFSFVELVPSAVWRSNPAFRTSVEMGRWIYPCAALLFFGLFGFAEEARRHYRSNFTWIKKRLGISSMPSPFISLRTKG